MSSTDLDQVKFDSQGLIPCIVQNAQSGKVLMLGYMNKESLDATLRTKMVTFFSRSRSELWVKGETSGNTLELVSISADCDSDSLLVKVSPTGPTCHTGAESCFDQSEASL
jgi:phosphoribosyl-AMP cyclohydrolase